MGEYSTTHETPEAFPLLRVWLCGPFEMAWIDPANGRTLPTDASSGGRDRAAAISLLALLLRQPTRQAHRDWIMEQFWPENSRTASVHRLENIFSCLRTMLRPPDGGESLVRSATGKKTGGPSYYLDAYPTLWVDTDALTWYVEQAARLERFGENPLPFWERAFALVQRGPFLADRPYEAYATWLIEQRGWLEGYRRQCVHALARLLLAFSGEAGKDEALLLLRTYWQQYKTDEDALRPLLELLGEQERYQEAEAYYQQLLVALAEQESDEDGQAREPDARTRDIREYLRTKHIRRSQTVTDEVLRGKAEYTGSSPFSNDLTFVNTQTRLLSTGRRRSLSEGQRAHVQAPFISPTPMRGDASMYRVLRLPSSVIEPPSSSENMVPDFTTQFGMMCAQILTLVQQWYGMATFYHALQNYVDQRIKKLDMLKPLSSLETYTLSRRSFLTTLAALPTACLASRKHMHTTSLDVEELLPQCAASITSCWHLSGGSHLDAIGPILDSYVPTLIAIIKNVPSYREVAADLVAQCYILKAILAWHLQGLTVAETYCLHALEYSDIAQNVNLRLTALNQHALISYYTKQCPKALARSEEASTILQRTSQEHIFPIVQGRVFMYLAAFQAQQSRTDAEQTLEQARYAFDLQTTLNEPVPLYADCGDASLSLWEGLTQYHLSLHDPTRAERALLSLRTFGRLQSDMEIPERFRLECLTHRIVAASQCYEMDEAIDCFEAANRGSKALESRQRSAEVESAFQVLLRRWPKEKRVQHLGTLL